MEVSPRVEVDCICVTPAILPRCRSSGAATVRAMTSGEPPALEAETEITGRSTSGRSETGRWGSAISPDSTAESSSSVVATGRWTNQAMNFKEDVPSLREGSLYKTIDAGVFSKEHEKIFASFQRAFKAYPAEDVTVMAAPCTASPCSAATRRNNVATSGA